MVGAKAQPLHAPSRGGHKQEMAALRAVAMAMAMAM
jgi:hypothetical protein